MSRTSQSSRSSPCVVCGVPLDHFTNKRKIPDYLCSKCFHEYKDHLDAPWMKYLMNQERYRRMKKQRQVKAGTAMEELSMDRLAEAGYTISSNILRDNHERTRPRRRNAASV